MAFPLKNHTESPRFIMGLWEMTDLNLCDLPLHASPIHSEQHSFKLKLISERDESHAKTKEFRAEFIGVGLLFSFPAGAYTCFMAMQPCGALLFLAPGDQGLTVMC